MARRAWRWTFWWRWVAANGAAELLGLGTVAALGFLVATRLGEPAGVLPTLAFAALFVVLGAFEGLVVGVAQARVLRLVLPDLRGWIGASVVGAVVAWLIGMVPSTVISVAGPEPSGPPPEMAPQLQLALAAALGAVAGPVLAFFQWRRLRTCIARGSIWWLPANAAAWSVGMPIVFAGADASGRASSPTFAVIHLGVALGAAGIAVGAVHGSVLVWLLRDEISSGCDA